MVFHYQSSWQREWKEYDPVTSETVTLTHGRYAVSRSKYVTE